MKWDQVTQLNITDPRSLFWRRYKERLSGVPAEQWEIRDFNCDILPNTHEICLESSIWKDYSSQILQTFNSVTQLKAVNLNDEKCGSLTVNEVIDLYRRGIDDDVILKNSILIDVNCNPIVEKFSGKIGDVGKCCVTESLRSTSNTMALQDICGKRTDLGGTTDWVMKRYGGNRRESSMFVNLMWWVTWYVFTSCGRYGVKMLMDATIGMCAGATIEQLSFSDGDRTTHRIDKTELANAATNSAAKSVTLSGRVRLAIETVIASRRTYANRYCELYKEMSNTANPQDVTPKTYLTSRYSDGMFSLMVEMLLAREYGKSHNTMNGNMCCRDKGQAIMSGCYYNDISDAVLDMKYKETHNYVICAKINATYTFSDHYDALSLALTTFDKPCISNDICDRSRICRYRFANAVYFALWPRYRACDRARRYVSTLNNEDLNKLIVKGRMCLQGRVYIKNNIWLDAVCSNYNNRRADLQSRGYTQSLLYLLGAEDDQVVKHHIHSAVKAIGMRPFDTGLEFVMSVGSVWLAKLALRTIKSSTSYDNLVAELSDLLSTLSLSSMPIITKNTITPCETESGALSLRLTEMLTVVSDINTVVGEAIMRTVAAVISMVSLDPFRCVAHHADTLLLN